MKRFIRTLMVGLVVAATSLTVSAQVVLTSRYKKALDTVTNTGVKNMSTPLAVKGAQQNVTVGLVITKLTGTAAGVARLYGSLDGVNYSRIRANSLQGQGTAIAVDSLIVRDVASQAFYWPVVDSPYQWYQVQTTGSGTTTFTVAGKYVAH